MGSEVAVGVANEFYTPSEVGQMIVGAANSIASSFGKLGFVLVGGVLGLIPDSKYPTYYGVELRDVSGNGVLLLDLPKTLKPEAFHGKAVVVGGFLQAKKPQAGRGMQFVLQASRIELQIQVSPEVLQVEKSLREVLAWPSAGATDFPEVANLSISCIHGRASQVLLDFENAIGGLEGVTIRRIAVNLQDPDSLAEGIRQASGDVALLIRGGGPEGDFEVFNRPAIIEAWRDLVAHKISALGHSANTTLLDRFSHRVCSTPTDAGGYIRKRRDEARVKAYLIAKTEEADKTMAATQRQMNLEFERRLTEAAALSKKDADAIRSQADQKLAELTQAANKQAESLRERAEAMAEKNRVMSIELARRPGAPVWAWVAVALVLALGATVVWLLK